MANEDNELLKEEDFDPELLEAELIQQISNTPPATNNIKSNIDNKSVIENPPEMNVVIPAIDVEEPEAYTSLTQIDRSSTTISGAEIVHKNIQIYREYMQRRSAELDVFMATHPDMEIIKQLILSSRSFTDAAIKILDTFSVQFRAADIKYMFDKLSDQEKGDLVLTYSVFEQSYLFKLSNSLEKIITKINNIESRITELRNQQKKAKKDNQSPLLVLTESIKYDKILIMYYDLYSDYWELVSKNYGEEVKKVLEQRVVLDTVNICFSVLLKHIPETMKKELVQQVASKVQDFTNNIQRKNVSK